MVAIKVKISPDAKKALDAKPLLSDHVRLTFRTGLKMIQQEARNNHRFISRSNKLENNIDSRLLSDSPILGEIYINDSACPYGKYQHDGVDRTWKIQAKNKQSLRFVGTSGNFNFVNKTGYVIHPGLKPDKFIQKAIDKKIDKFTENLETAILQEFNS